MDTLFVIIPDRHPLLFPDRPLFSADMLREMARIGRILFAVWHCPSFQPPGFNDDSIAEAITYNRISAALANIANIHLNSSMKAASLWAPSRVMFMPFGEGCEVTESRRPFFFGCNALFHSMLRRSCEGRKVFQENSIV